MSGEKKIYSISEELDATFGKEGSRSRAKAEEEAWEEYNAHILLEARKNAHLTQGELAERLGVDKSYISKVERGLIVPGIAVFYRMVSAMGLRIDLRALGA